MSSAVMGGLPRQSWTWDPYSRSGRSARAGVFAAASSVLAVSAHRLAGGAVPAPATITLAASLLLILGCGLSRRERSGGQITVLVLLTQALLHVSFMLSTMSHPMSAAMSSAPLSTAELTKMLFCFSGSAGPSAAQVSAAMSGMDISHLRAAAAVPHMDDNPFTAAGLCMVSAHLLAAAATAWWLRRGERAACKAIERVVTILKTASSPRPIGRTRVRLRAVAELSLSSQQVWGSGLAGRGPPARRLLNFPIA